MHMGKRIIELFHLYIQVTWNHVRTFQIRTFA